MKGEQFTALAQLLRLRAGPAREVARLVMVGGLPVPDAARQAGLDYKSAHKAVQRARVALDLARRAAGLP